MDYQKTGRLIKKKRNEMSLTQQLLSEKLGVTPQAVSLWEKGKRFPDASAQLMLFKVLDLNPVELLTGLEIFDEELKHGIAAHMKRIDEKVFVAGMVKDEDDNDFYLDMTGFSVVTANKKGELTDKWIPFTEYYNVEPAPRHEDPNTLPVSDYDPDMIYINHSDCIFVIPVEMLEMMGRPLYFNIFKDDTDSWIRLQFTDKLGENGFDIPEKVYNGKWRGIHVLGGEFGKKLCKKMGIRRSMDLVSVEPEFVAERRSILLFLDKAKRVNTKIDYGKYLLPQWQYDAIWEDEDLEEEIWDEE